MLLLDPDTTKVVSLVYSQSEILEQEVYLVEKLDSERTERLLHLKVLHGLCGAAAESQAGCSRHRA